MTRNIPIHILQDTSTHAEWYVYSILRGKGRTFYNWTYKSLSAYTKLSHTLLRKRLPQLISLGWARVEGNNLIFLSTNELKSHPKETVIPIHTSRNKKQTILLLRNAMLRGNLKQQRKQHSKKSEIVKKITTGKSLTKKEYLLIQKSGGVNSFVSQVKENVATTLSNFKIGKLISRSQSTGKRLQKALRQANLICSKSRIKILATNVSKAEWQYSELSECLRNIYNTDRLVAYRRLSNEITVK